MSVLLLLTESLSVVDHVDYLTSHTLPLGGLRELLRRARDLQEHALSNAVEPVTRGDGQPGAVSATGNNQAAGLAVTDEGANL